MDILYSAMALAVKAHDGQKDKTGQPYILHPSRVMLSLWKEMEEQGLSIDEELLAGAMCHDVFEDTIYGPDMVMGDIPQSVIETIKIVSRQKGETYKQFIYRIASSGDERAIRIKIADLNDNLDPVRTKRFAEMNPEKSQRLQKRYKKALSFLASNMEDGADEDW